MKSKILFCGLLIILTFISASCDIIPSDFNFNVNADIDTTSELGPETLDRVDAVNDTLATGIEVGPETRETIAELNETLANGIKAGFDEETLARVDELLRVVEDGLKIGLDDETLDSIDGLVETIDQMPGNWEATGQNIIQTLENAAGTTAGRLADEVSNLMVDARINYQQMTAITGIEFRCNVDFLGSKMGSTAQEFIGKSIVGKLKRILSGEPEVETIPTPWVCQLIPDTLTLSKIGDRLVFEAGIITLTGYNYVDANSPTAVIVDESGKPVPGIPLYPYRSSPYQIQLNLQDLDFSPVPARSRIMFTWPNVSESSGIAILMPGHEPPVANFSVDKTRGNAPLTVQFTDTSSGNPVNWEWVFGDGSTSLEENPSHTFIERRDFLVQLTVQNAQGQSSVTSTISVGTELAADFSFSPGDGDSPLLVQFKDKSSGGPTSWLWNFGDGSPTSTEQDPQHLFMNANAEGYQVSLTVNNGSASSTKTASNRIKVMEELEAQFKANTVSGKPPINVIFTDQSKGGNSIVGWKWDFGDGTPISTQRSPSHTYTKKGNFDVSLTITRADGKQDIEVKNDYINSFTIQSMLIPQFMYAVKIKDQSIFFTSFATGPGGTQLDTKISYSKYVCGVNGMVANNGVISHVLISRDGLRVYMFPQNSSPTNQQTWWLMADFEDLTVPGYPKETWNVNVICFSRTLEGSVFLYRDDFRNIKGGTPFKTGIKTSEYFNCGVTGVVGRGATGFLFGTMFPIVVQATMDGSGDEWIINSDMPVYLDGDIWDIKVLCLKKGSFNNVEKPPFLTKTVSFYNPTTQVGTDINTSDYLCGVYGYTAELGDLYTIHPGAPIDAGNLAATVLAVRTFQKNGKWWVEADIAHRYKAEDWTVNLLCVRRPIAVEGMPPP